MEGLTALGGAGGRFLLPFPSTSTTAVKNHRSLSLRRPGPPPVLASPPDRPGPELDKWDQMELKFGRLLGEDPKLTLAKIMARKADPDVSYLEVEKEFMKKKGNIDDTMMKLLENVDVERRSFESSNRPSVPLQNPQKLQNTGNLNLSRPMMNKGLKITRPSERPAPIQKQANQLLEKVDNKGDSNVSLRKPAFMPGDDIEADSYSKMKIKPNLHLKMRTKSSDDFSDIALLKKPEVIQMPLNPEPEKISSSASVESGSPEMITPDDTVKLELERPNAAESSDALQQNMDRSQLDEADVAVAGSSHSNSDFSDESSTLDDGLQPSKRSGVEHRDAESPAVSLGKKSLNYSSDVPMRAPLLGKPQRLDSSVKEVSHPTGKETFNMSDEIHNFVAYVEDSVSAEQEEREDGDWKMAEDLFHTGNRAEVELISCSSRGFVVSFGSLIGFLPYRNLGAKWKFVAFESWLRKKGLDPALYRHNLSITGRYDGQNKTLIMESNKNEDVDQNNEETLPRDIKFEDLLEAYDQEKTKFLSSFVGQRIKVSVTLADRNSRRLLFSGRAKEKEELVVKKRNLMAKLSVGDVVKCCIKKITYFGIFVEVDGVPALIHQSEVSWDATLDPSSYFKIGQTVEAKVHQLDFALERITLSLKEITPDPLMEALESVVGERTSMGGNLEAAQADVEWADVEALIEELQQIDGVHKVSKGRFFLSPGLAPTFQVYMAPMFASQYKLLARYGNKVQEVIVQSSLDKEQIKAAILACTNRVQ